MKFLSILALAIPLSLPASPLWVPITQSLDESTKFSIDQTSYHIRGYEVEFSVQILTPQGSSLTSWRVDCTDKSAKIVYIIAYNNKGDIKDVIQGPIKVSPKSPGSVADALISYSCNII